MKIAEELTASDRWIKVSERLPEVCERVMMFHIGIGMQIGWLGHNDMWNGYYGHVHKNHVTHWQPLPEPPKD